MSQWSYAKMSCRPRLIDLMPSIETSGSAYVLSSITPSSSDHNVSCLSEAIDNVREPNWPMIETFLNSVSLLNVVERFLKSASSRLYSRDSGWEYVPGLELNASSEMAMATSRSLIQPV